MDWNVILTSSAVAGVVGAVASLFTSLLTLRFQRRKEASTFRLSRLTVVHDRLIEIDRNELAGLNETLLGLKLSGDMDLEGHAKMIESIRMASKASLRLYDDNRVYLTSKSIAILEPKLQNVHANLDKLVTLQREFNGNAPREVVLNAFHANKEHEDSFFAFFTAFKGAVSDEIAQARRF